MGNSQAFMKKARDIGMFEQVDCVWFLFYFFHFLRRHYIFKLKVNKLSRKKISLHLIPNNLHFQCKLPSSVEIITSD